MSGLVADLVAAVERLGRAGVPSPRVDAELLAAHAAGLDRGGLQRLLVMRGAWPDGAAERFADLVAARESRVPLQHLIGRAGFRGLDLQVGPGVFVPRPETELSAGLAVAELRRSTAAAAPVAVDLCTGSGAIALALAVEVPGARVGAVELSPHAHAWAVRNVRALAPQVELHLGDVADTAGLLPDLLGCCDVVTANPPYVPDDAVPLDPEVAEHDPPVALYGGHDGMRVLRVCVRVAAGLLHAGGLLVLEHGELQCDTVAAVLAADPGAGSGWSAVEHHVDLAGRPRATTARLAGSLG